VVVPRAFRLLAGRRRLEPIAVGIVDANEIFRHGLIACLSSDRSIEVVYEGEALPDGPKVALLITSTDVAQRWPAGVPLVVCTDTPLSDHARTVNQVMGVLPRATLKPSQLLAGVRAAASGLQVNMLDTPTCDLSTRSVEVLRLLAQGAATRQISDTLGYSERTIKHAVAEVLEELGARSRAEAVAIGIRRGLI
jgi:DNA-binding NarL/FixJ family response regulator